MTSYNGPGRRRSKSCHRKVLTDCAFESTPEEWEGGEARVPVPAPPSKCTNRPTIGCCRCGGTAVGHLQCRSLTSFKNASTIYRAGSTSWTLSYHCFVKNFQMAADVMVMKNKTPRAWRPLSRSVRLSKEKILSQDQPSDLTIHSIGPAPTSTTPPSGCGVW